MPHTYRVEESESPPWIVEIRPQDGFILSPRYTSDFRVRGVVYDMLKVAQAALPPEYRLVIYEAFRPRSRQWELWRWMEREMRHRFPNASDDEIYTRTREFVADPRGFGSGHQAGGAVDVTLADADGNELDMGTDGVELVERARTHSPDITPQQRENRRILLEAMEAAGLVNYPSEWWHYCYGDRLWAEMTRANVAIFAPIEEGTS
jgi:D-alanyl-D-alanine dipeptidase